MGNRASKIKVLEICVGDFGIGGGGVILWSWYQNIDLTKIHIDFFCRIQPEDSFLQIIKKNGGHCYVRKSYKNRLVRKAAELQELRKIIKMGNYDCVHTHFSAAYLTLPAFFLARNHVEKVIMHSHSKSASNVTKKIIQTICKQFLRGSKIVPLACSGDAAAWLFPSKIVNGKWYTVIKNGIDSQRFSFDQVVRDKVRTELGVSKKFVIGHVGSFTYPKNHVFLIDVFAQIHKKFPDAVLLLIGDGNKFENSVGVIKEKVCSLGLTDNVIFYGHTDRVNEMYQAMDYFVFPSHYEGLGIVLIEAQAAGLKTLCSNAVPKEAKITKLLEYMSLTESPEKWADEILVYNNSYPRKNMVQEVIQAGYDIKDSAKKLEEIYLASRC